MEVLINQGYSGPHESLYVGMKPVSCASSLAIVRSWKEMSQLLHFHTDPGIRFTSGTSGCHPLDPQQVNILHDIYDLLPEQWWGFLEWIPPWGANRSWAVGQGTLNQGIPKMPNVPGLNYIQFKGLVQLHGDRESCVSAQMRNGAEMDLPGSRKDDHVWEDASAL